ncbi:MAG: hypothetical protein GX284_10975 [Clostridiales bacterium]|uniref:DUF6709 family protein n=1 Tax=Roseburia sp. MSJ-14 TaxID=2841514 RepID=UPI0016A2C828|nr:DUF6709 family protein [Roseburia sp. MSJ-14]MBU5473531.1 hypothetical protein [Roseburia sp. MSJ-14]NLK78205.1 hypothetical protein [Clostridiales bacterium]
MEEFKKNLLKICGKNIVAPIIFLGIGVLFLVIGLIPEWTTYKSFDPQSDGYATLDVTYVMGPFAELVNDNKSDTEFYIAEDSDGYWNIIATKKGTSLPVYGVDVQDDDLNTLTGQTIRGESTLIPYEASRYLVDYLSDAGLDITTSNYSEYFGDYYLDTTHPANENSIYLYIVAAAFAFISILIFTTGNNKKKAVKKKISTLEQTGEFQQIYSDFSVSPSIFSSNMKLAVSNHFILDFNDKKDGFSVMPLNTITNVFKCNMVNGEPTTDTYIALETADGTRSLLSARKNKDLDKIIAQLKANINQGGITTW